MDSKWKKDHLIDSLILEAFENSYQSHSDEEKIQAVHDGIFNRLLGLYVNHTMNQILISLGVVTYANQTVTKRGRDYVAHNLKLIRA